MDETLRQILTALFQAHGQLDILKAKVGELQAEIERLKQEVEQRKTEP